MSLKLHRFVILAPILKAGNCLIKCLTSISFFLFLRLDITS